MNRTTLILISLAMLLVVAVSMPRMIAMNRGKLLRNTAIWLAIMLGLALLYQLITPGQSLRFPRLNATDKSEAETLPATDQPVGAQGYTPPKE